MCDDLFCANPGRFWLFLYPILHTASSRHSLGSMENKSYPVNRAFYQDLPMPVGPPDPRFSKHNYARQPKEAKSSLHEALEILRLGKWYIFGVTFLVLSAVAVYTFTSEPEYEASTIMLIDSKFSERQEDIGTVLPKQNLAGNAGIEKQVHILRNSIDIAQRTANSLIERRTLPGSSQPLNILTQATSVNQLSELLQEEVLTFSVANESVDAIEISAASNTAEEAALIANLYAEEYVRETEDMSKERLTAQRIFLEQQYNEKKIELDNIETRLANYMNSEGVAALGEQAKYTVAQIAQSQAMLEEARIELSMRESNLLSLEEEMREIQPHLSTRISSNVESQIEQVQGEITKLESRVEDIYFRQPDLRNNPSQNAEVQTYHEQITQLRAKLRTLSDQFAIEVMNAGGVNPKAEGLSMNYLANLKRQITDNRINITGQQARVKTLQEQLRNYDVRLRTIPGQQIELAKMERQRQATAELFGVLEQKLSEIKFAEESERGFAEVLKPATAPEDPIKPQKAINLLMGLMLGLMLGTGAAVARSKFDTRVYSPEDLNSSDVTMLGVVPDMRQLIKKEFGKRLKIDFEGREVSTALAALVAPMSPTAEAYRRLYIKLQFSRDDMGIQNLMITSPKAGAGKSTTALNLAFTSAQAGKRTLVIDADLRRPSLHDKLGLPEGASLLELLSEDESRWDSERFFTGIENVYVITGIPVSQPTELLGSRKMMDLIDRFRTEFDIIIFDTPPVLGAVDPILLSRQCDGVIVVASSDNTDMEALNQTLDELRSVSANVLGTVLNRFDPSGMYGYKNTYGYSYGSNSYVAS